MHLRKALLYILPRGSWERVDAVEVLIDDATDEATQAMLRDQVANLLVRCFAYRPSRMWKKKNWVGAAEAVSDLGVLAL